MAYKSVTKARLRPTLGCTPGMIQLAGYSNPGQEIQLATVRESSVESLLLNNKSCPRYQYVKCIVSDRGSGCLGA